jgi:hypothetical protein
MTTLVQVAFARHPRVVGDPVDLYQGSHTQNPWIPVFTGMTVGKGFEPSMCLVDIANLQLAAFVRLAHPTTHKKNGEIPLPILPVYQASQYLPRLATHNIALLAGVVNSVILQPLPWRGRSSSTSRFFPEFLSPQRPERFDRSIPSWSRGSGLGNDTPRLHKLKADS